MELKPGDIISSSAWEYLLIVPYGIETKPFRTLTWTIILLIVPYGIETMDAMMYFFFLVAFNRTLWN